LKCVETILPDCKSPEQVERVRKNVLFMNLELAKNESSLFGDSYVASCPELVKAQEDILLDVFGSTRCSYKEAFDKVDKRLNCTKDAFNLMDSKLNAILTLISGREAKL